MRSIANNTGSADVKRITRTQWLFAVTYAAALVVAVLDVFVWRAG
jgi:hypothetical protein